MFWIYIWILDLLLFWILDLKPVQNRPKTQIEKRLYNRRLSIQ
jgi:hypothetical protein